MVAWRDRMRAMRDVVHSTFLISCVYVPPSPLDPQKAGVRLRNKTAESNFSQIGAGRGWAVIADPTPHLRFSRLEVSKPRKHALICISESEAYRLTNVLPYDDQYVDVEAERLSVEDAQAAWQSGYADILAS